MSDNETPDGELTQDPSPDRAVQPERQFSIALGLYGLWGGLAWLSHTFDQTTIPEDAAVILLGGIIATNCMFFALANSTARHWLPHSTVILAQSVFAVVWVTLYGFMSTGPGQLVPFIYMTALLFALPHIEHRSLFQLASFSAAAYSLVIVLKNFLATPETSIGASLVQLLIYAVAVGWIVIYGQRLQDLRTHLTQKNASLQSIIDKMTRTTEQQDLEHSASRRYMMESLIREKGRTDRSNYPFSIGIFNVDDFDEFVGQHGSLAGEKILKSFAQRIRGALRAMDSATPSGFKRRFGQLADEEYIVILPQTGLIGAERCAERICAAIRKRSFDDTYRRTVSGGVAEYKRGESIPDLLGRADEALREAQRAGGDRIVCSEPRGPRRAAIVPLRKRTT